MKISIGKDNDNVNFKTVDVTSIKELCEVILTNPYSLSIYKNNYRNLDNFIQSNAIGFDVDEGLTLEKAKEIFKDYRHIIAISRNHQKDKYTKKGVLKPACDRFRIILFLKEPITDIETFYSTWFSVEAESGQKFDPACKDPSRFWYKSRKIISKSLKGKLIDPVAPKPVTEKHTEISETNQTDKGKLSNKTLSFLLNGAEVGYRHGELYKAARDAHQQGYTQEEFLVLVEKLVKNSNDEEYLDASSKQCIGDAFQKDPKHEPRITEKAFQFKRIGELYKDRTKISWIVDRLLTKGGVSLLSADAKAGKSTILRQLIKQILVGGMFLGRQCLKGKVLYLAAEEQVEIINECFQQLQVGSESELYIHLGEPLTDNSVNDMIEAIKQYKPTLLALDTMFDFIDVENENGYKEVKRELRKIRKIARDTGTHIMLVHHSSKQAFGDSRRGARGILGSQAIAGGVDTIIIMEIDENDQRLITTSGRKIKRWVFKEMKYDIKTDTYSLAEKSKKKKEDPY